MHLELHFSVLLLGFKLTLLFPKPQKDLSISVKCSIRSFSSVLVPLGRDGREIEKKKASFSPLTAHCDDLSGLHYIVVKKGALVQATVVSGNASQSVDILVSHRDLLALRRAREREMV